MTMRPPIDDAPDTPVANAFGVLLQRLAQESEAPERVYESLRYRLIAFFRVRFAVEAETLADSTLDRVARKLSEGTEIQKVPAFALGVARMILLERQSRSQREQQALEAAPVEEPADDPASVLDAQVGVDLMEQRLLALQRCLSGMGAEASHLILNYYSGDGSERIRGRQQLADELGLSLNALRNRALRLRAALERCLGQSLARDESRLPDTHCVRSEPS